MAVRFALIAVSIAGVSQPVSAKDGLDLSGSVRVRYETIENQVRPGYNGSDDLLNVRTILSAAYRDGPVRIGAELFDSRVRGGDPGTPVSSNEVNALELVQIWIGGDVEAPFGSGSRLSLQAGRFTLNLGSRRLVAADDYRNTTNGYTGLRADLSLRGGIRATAVYVLPQMRLPDDAEGIGKRKVRWDRESFDIVLWGGVVGMDIPGPALAELSFFHLGERDGPSRPTRDRSLDTVSARLARTPAAGKLDYELEVMRQTGAIRADATPAAPMLEVSAWFLHADAGRTFSVRWTPRLSLEFDYASGDRGGGRYNRFDTVFGMRRADLAPSGMYNAIGRANIISPGIRIEAVPSRRIDWFATYRAMWLASRTDGFSTSGVRDPSGSSGRFAGHQLDARIRWWAVPERVRVELNFVTLIKGRFLIGAPNAPAGGDTRYASFNITTSF